MIHCLHLMNTEILVNATFAFLLLTCHDSPIKLSFINTRTGKYAWNSVNLTVKETKIVV